MKLDHFFILTDPDAPHAELLSDLGLIEGPPKDHPGQGTANRLFFFSNSALELLYVRDATEAAEGPGRRLRLPERAGDLAASPFGLVFTDDPGLTRAPFESWRYQPDYFGPERYFLVGDNSDLTVEPLCIYMPFDPPSRADKPRSAWPFLTISELRIDVPVEEPSAVLETVSRVDRISLRTGADHRLEIVFDDGKNNETRDLRPQLPLVLRW